MKWYKPLLKGFALIASLWFAYACGFNQGATPQAINPAEEGSQHIHCFSSAIPDDN